MNNDLLIGELLNDETAICLEELCRICHTDKQFIIELVNYGLLDPIDPDETEWEFTWTIVGRVQTVLRLQQDLEVNLSGAILIVEMLDELNYLRRKLQK